MNATMKRVSVLVVGWAFIVLGILGLFLPILQGVLFLVIGLLILSSEYVWAHRLLAKLRERFPSVARAADEAKAKLSSWMRRLLRQQPAD